MNSKSQKPLQNRASKLDAPTQHVPHHDLPDDRYPGSFFRVPGVPTPGKTTWSLAK